MASNNDSVSSYLWRILCRDQAFRWLREKRGYTKVDLDSCLNILEENPIAREAAFCAFWGAYLANELPVVVSDKQLEKVKRLLDYGALPSPKIEKIKDLAFVKLHLAGLLIICLLRPDSPVSENPSVITVLEKALEAYKLAEPPAVDIDDPPGWGKKLFRHDLFGFSIILVGGISRVELSLIGAEQRNYEEALSLASLGAWDVCATTIEEESGVMHQLRLTYNIPETTTMKEESGFPGFQPYMPHSGQRFNIQEIIDIFEEAKKHCRDIKDWEAMENYCDVLRYLGFFNLYDSTIQVRPFIAEGLGAAEYWGRASTFAEYQKRIVASPFPIVTKDAIEHVETRERLKRDFLSDTWEELTEEAQKILVDAEIEWMHKRLDNMVKDIRPMLELVLLSTFPFLGPMITRSDPRLILTRIRNELQENRMLPVLIDSFQIDNLDKAWATDELPKFLQKVIHTRNYFEKEQDSPSKKSGENWEMIENAVSIHGELLGIGCSGVLPRLMKIKRAIRPKK